MLAGSPGLFVVFRGDQKNPHIIVHEEIMSIKFFIKYSVGLSSNGVQNLIAAFWMELDKF